MLSWRVNREGLEDEYLGFTDGVNLFPFHYFCRREKRKRNSPLTGEKFNPLPPPSTNHQGLERKSSSEFHSLVVELCSV